MEIRGANGARNIVITVHARHARFAEGGIDEEHRTQSVFVSTLVLAVPVFAGGYQGAVPNRCRHAGL